MMKLGEGGKCIVQKSLPSSNLGVIARWVRTPKMWRWATTLGKSAHGIIVNCGKQPRQTTSAHYNWTSLYRCIRRYEVVSLCKLN